MPLPLREGRAPGDRICIGGASRARRGPHTMDSPVSSPVGFMGPDWTGGVVIGELAEPFSRRASITASEESEGVVTSDDGLPLDLSGLADTLPSHGVVLSGPSGATTGPRERYGWGRFICSRGSLHGEPGACDCMKKIVGGVSAPGTSPGTAGSVVVAPNGSDSPATLATRSYCPVSSSSSLSDDSIVVLGTDNDSSLRPFSLLGLGKSTIGPSSAGVRAAARLSKVRCCLACRDRFSCGKNSKSSLCVSCRRHLSPGECSTNADVIARIRCMRLATAANAPSPSEGEHGLANRGRTAGGVVST